MDVLNDPRIGEIYGVFVYSLQLVQGMVHISVIARSAISQ